MSALDRALLRIFLPIAVGRACPSTIVRSGDDACKTNCFVVAIDEGDEPHFVLLGMTDNLVTALEYDGQKYAIDHSIPLNDIDPSKIRITHFYGPHQIDFYGIRDFAIGRAIGLPYLMIDLVHLWHRIVQRLFNRRSLVIKQRLDILREAAELVKSGSTSIGTLEIMTGRYGYRWASHPDWQRHDQLITFYLEGLCDTGDLKKINHSYVLTGQAIKTLEDAEEQDRRHLANFRLQLLLAILTAVSAVMAAAQAGLIKLPTLIDLT